MFASRQPGSALSLLAHPVRVDERLIASMRDTGAYRVRVLVPSLPAGPAGYPVLIMLDGDALLPELLAHFAGTAVPQQVPVLVVLISHAAQGEAARQARVYDYTPGLPGHPRPADPRVPAWRNGGADDLLTFIDTSIMPWINGHYGTDTARVTFYGHSYGGLCVLHALCAQSMPCTRYVAVSPSAWWQDGAILAEIEAAAARVLAPADVLVMVGTRETWHRQPTGPDGSPDSREGGEPTLPAARDLAQALSRLDGLRVGFRAVEGGTHHTMLAQSVAPALAFAQRIEALPATASVQEHF
ncbi:MAG: alpha/beta hydrolase [Comamonadaceae bacterium]|nr:MAG: alpha/beta hydrolase [Comamonadaceae bacterium]